MGSTPITFSADDIDKPSSSTQAPSSGAVTFSADDIDKPATSTAPAASPVEVPSWFTGSPEEFQKQQNQAPNVSPAGQFQDARSAGVSDESWRAAGGNPQRAMGDQSVRDVEAQKTAGIAKGQNAFNTINPGEHPLEYAGARTAGALITGLSLGMIDPVQGTTREAPWAARQQDSEPMQYGQGYDINLAPILAQFARAGQESENPTALNPQIKPATAADFPDSSINTTGAATGTAEMIGSMPAYGGLSSAVDAGLARATAPIAEGIAGPAMAPGLATGAQAAQFQDAAQKLLMFEAGRRVAGQTITGAAFGAGTSEPGHRVEGAVSGAEAGAGFGAANEALGSIIAQAKAQGHANLVTDVHDELADFLLSREKIKMKDGTTVEVNTREKAERMAQDILANAKVADPGGEKNLKAIRQQIKQAQETFDRQKAEQERVKGPEGTTTINAEETTPQRPPEEPEAGTPVRTGENPRLPSGGAGPAQKPGEVVFVKRAGYEDGRPAQVIKGGLSDSDGTQLIHVEYKDGTRELVAQNELVQPKEKAVSQPTQVTQPEPKFEADDRVHVTIAGEDRAGKVVSQTGDKVKVEFDSGNTQEVQASRLKPGTGTPKVVQDLSRAVKNTLQTEPETSSKVDRPIAAGAQVRLQVEGSPVEGTVKWTDGKTARITTESGKKVTRPVEQLERTKGTKPTISETKEPQGETTYKYGSTQIDIEKSSELGKKHEAAVRAIPEEHIGKEGREETPHVTVRYGLKDTEPKTIANLKEAVSKIKAFDLPVGKTDIFPATEHSGGDNPVISKVEATPELQQLRDAVEKSGNFKEDNFKDYRPHITLGYVKPEHAQGYKGGSQLEGQTVRVDHLTISKQDGTTEKISLAPRYTPEQEAIKKGDRVEANGIRGTVQLAHEHQLSVLTDAGTTKVVKRGDAQPSTAPPPTKLEKNLASAKDRKENGKRPEQGSASPAGGAETSVEGGSQLKLPPNTLPGGGKLAATHKEVEQKLKAAQVTESTPTNIAAPHYVDARHGQTEYNGKTGTSTELIRGTSNVPLNEEGRKEAHEMGKLLQTHPITKIFSSPLDRAHETAQIVASYLEKHQGKKIPIEKVENLKPWDQKALEGKPVKDNLDKLDQYMNNPDQVIPGGESYNQYLGRFEGVLREKVMPAAEAGEIPLIVAHSKHQLATPFLLSGGKDLIPPTGGLEPGSAMLVVKGPDGFQLYNGEQGESNASTASQGRPQVPGTQSQGEKPLGDALPQPVQEPEGKRDAGRKSRQGSTEHDRAAESVPSERTEPGPSEGTRVSDDSPAGGEIVRKKAKKLTKNHDWYVHPEDFSVDAGNTQRLEWNLEALKIAKAALEDGQALTDADKEKLAHFVGWGALQWVFAPHRAPLKEQDRWVRAHGELKKLLDEDAMKRAAAFTQNAHYTSPDLVRWIWKAVSRMGFDGGSILEPSMGSGNFFGLMPKKFRDKSNAIGNELDPGTFNIAKLLYPGATLFNQDFVKLMLPNDSVDLTIGNPPFGPEKMFDPKYPKMRAEIHDYFFMKALDKVRPGGLLAFITSTGTMDKRSSGMRERLADSADLAFAMRLPQNTFDKNAGTKVITDFIVLRKRLQGEKPDGPSWMNLKEIEAPYAANYGKVGKGVKQINEYFAEHPDHILGDMEIGHGQWEPDALIIRPSGNIKDQLEEVLNSVPKLIYTKAGVTPFLAADTEQVFAADHLEEGNYGLVDGQVMQRENGVMKPAANVLAKTGANKGKPSPDLTDRVKQLIGLRDGTRGLIRTMRSVSNDEEGNAVVKREQAELYKTYKTYISKHGYLNEQKTRGVFRDDPHFPLLLSLENYDKKEKTGAPSDIFSRRTIIPPTKLTQLSKDAKEALYQTLAERGHPDIDFMAEMSGTDKDDIVNKLTSAGLIFRSPVSGLWETKDKYLTGSVRAKLKDAKEAVDQGQKEFEPNVAALEKVIPKDVPLQEIRVRPGQTWLPMGLLTDFVQTTFNQGWPPSIYYVGGNWSMSSLGANAATSAQYGTSRMQAGKLFELALNQKTPLVYDSYTVDGKEVTTLNQKETKLAQSKMDLIKKDFQKFAQQSEKYGDTLVEQYNFLFNGFVDPAYSGAHLTFPGMSTTYSPGGVWPLRTHQVDAIWRVIQEGRGLLAHVVGSGKTFEFIGSAMEMKRLGMVHKPMAAVPNHLTEQWAEDWMRLYPGARILVPSKKDFEAINRNKLFSRIATNDWDGIIIAHSQFNQIDISEEYQRKSIDKDLEELEHAMDGARESEGKNSYTVKQLEKQKARMEQKLASLANLKADKTIKFDEMGIDHLMVDEAHEYKNLGFYTKMTRVSGLAQGDAKRASRLKTKTDYLHEKYNNRGMVLGTGTPVSNTMAEMYTMHKYVAPDVLINAGIKYFDDWAANFGTVVTKMELSVDAQTFRPRSAFVKFVNVPEMQRMFAQFADVKVREDLPELLKIIPKREKGPDGAPLMLIAPQHSALKPIMGSLIQRAAAVKGDAVPLFDDKGDPLMVPKVDDKGEEIVKNGEKVMIQATERRNKPKPEEDNMLAIVDTASKAALDLRLLGDNYPDHPLSKLNGIVEKVVEEWKEGKNEKTTGLIFLDRYRRIDKETGDTTLNLYHDVRDKLVSRGVPAEEIAIIHDFNRKTRPGLYQAVNDGKIRILMGSTQKMGAGMNVQRLLKWMVNGDYPWKPGELEQREGRIERQGNQNKKIRIWNALTERSFDTYRLQKLQTKAEFIHQVMAGRNVGREIEDAAGDVAMGYAEMKAAVSGNPDVRIKMELESKLAELESLERSFIGQQIANRNNAKMERERATRYRNDAQTLNKWLSKWRDTTKGDRFQLQVLGEDFNDKTKAREFLKEKGIPPGNIHVDINGMHSVIEPKVHNGNRYITYSMPWGATHDIHTMDGFVNSFIGKAESLEEQASFKIGEADRLEKNAKALDKLAREEKFEQADELKATEKELKAVNVRLGIDEDEALKDQVVEAEVTPDQDPAIDEDGEEDDDSAFDVAPQGWGEIEGNEPQPLPPAHYEPADGRLPPVLTINERQADMLSDLLGWPNFGGVSLNMAAAKGHTETLKDAVWEKNLVGNRDLQTITSMFDKAISSVEGVRHASIVVAVDRNDPEFYKKVLREEFFHATQRIVGHGRMAKHMGDPELLIQHPAMQKFIQAIQDRRLAYPTDNRALLVYELAAKIAAQARMLENVLTPEEEADWFVTYLGQVAAANHLSDLDLFNDPRIIGEKVQEFFDAVKDLIKEQPEDGYRKFYPADTGTGRTDANVQQDSAGAAQGSSGGRNQAAESPAFSLSGNGGGNRKPGKSEPFTFTDEEVEDAIQAAHGIEPKSILEKTKDGLNHLMEMATRKYEDLPREPQFEPLRFGLTNLEHQRGVTADAAIRDLKDILDGLDKIQYQNFERKVLLDDLVASIDDGLEVPFFDDHDYLRREHQRLTEFVGRDPEVSGAVKKRQQVWANVKRNYIAAQERIGFKVADRLKRDSYYRHQVLMHYSERDNTQGGGGKKLKTPTGRGFIKTRQGSSLPINTHYLQAEYEVMGGMRFDTEVAKAIAMVDREYNVAETLKQQAVVQNEAGIMDFFRNLIATHPEEFGDKTPQKLFRQILNSKQAIGFDRLMNLAQDNALPAGARGEWQDLVDALKENAIENQQMKAVLGENWDKSDRVELDKGTMSQLFRYGNWLMKVHAGSAGAKAMGTIYKGMAEKRAFIKENLGEEYATWQSLIPEGYRVWQPREGSMMYFTQTLPEHVVTALTEKGVESYGVTPEMLRSVLARGQRYREYVLPNEVADTLDNLRPEVTNNPAMIAFEKLTRIWKNWELHSPRRAIKFRMRHISGQLEAMFVGKPAAYSKLLEAGKQLYQFFKTAEIHPNLEPWLSRGGTGSLLRAVEMENIDKLKQFAKLFDENQTKKLSLAVLRGYVEASNFSIDFAESLLRYAAFLDYKEDMAANQGNPTSFGASTPDEVMALKNPNDRAFKLANDLLGAYDDISALGRQIRKVLPFYSFREANAKRYYRFFKNALKGTEYPSSLGKNKQAFGEKEGSGASGSGGGQKPPNPPSNKSSRGFQDGEGDGTSARRVGTDLAGKVLRASPFVAYRIGKLLIKMSALWAGLAAYNYLFHRKEEEDLPPEVQGSPHLIFGRNADGEILYTPKLGLLTDLMDWVGMDKPQWLVKQLADGHMTPGEAAKYMASAPFKSLINATNSLIKMPVELASGYSLFPDATNPKKIRDRADYISKSLAIEPEYKAITGQPSRGYGHTAYDLFANHADAGQSSYFDFLQLKQEWMAQYGKGEDTGGGTFNARTNALHNMKLAMHYGDQKAWEKYTTEYFAAGGKPEQIISSLKSMDPLSGLSEEQKIGFLSGLSPQDLEQFGRAEMYYLTYLDPGAAANIDDEETQKSYESPVQ